MTEEELRKEDKRREKRCREERREKLRDIIRAAKESGYLKRFMRELDKRINMARFDAELKPSQPKWEYEHIQMPMELQINYELETLEDFGKRHWELVNVIDRSGFRHYYFKRQKVEE